MDTREDFLAFGVPDITDAEVDAVTRVLRSGWIGMGKETLAFEEDLSRYLGGPEVITVNSCTSALFLALLTEGVGAGDEVIVPSLTWCATANAALYLGATPVLCDVDPRTMCVTPQSVAAKLSSRTKAVVVVHYGGFAVDVERLRQSLPGNVRIVEDAAHAFGSTYPDGRKVGTSGNAVCFSFYANKNLSTADGGAIALSDPERAHHLRSLRMNGMDSTAWARYIRPTAALVPGLTELGYKMNLTDLCSALGRVQLRRFDAMAAHRQKIAERYRSRLEEHGLTIAFQRGAFEHSHARHLLVGCFDPAQTGMPRDELLQALRARNIGACVHYRPLHRQPLYSQGGASQLPVTDSLADQIMTLPISARMTPADVDYVVDHLSCLIGPEGGRQ